MTRLDVIEMAAALIDPPAFERKPQLMVDVVRRDQARDRAIGAFVLYEAFRSGVIGEDAREAA